MKVIYMVCHVKIRFVSIFICLILIATGCNTATTEVAADSTEVAEDTTEVAADSTEVAEDTKEVAATTETDPNLTKTTTHPGVPGFDWANDPLEVTINEEHLVCGIDRDTLDLIAVDMHTYFHTMNTGDSADWDTHLSHFPLHKYSDTAILNTQFAGISHWKEKGFLNRMGKSDIKFVSDWIKEEDQMVAIVGSDIDFYMDFLPNFEGNPEGMRFVMGDKYGSDNITYNSYNEFDENGDSLEIRNWHAHTYSNLFAITTYDTLHFSFLPAGFNKAAFGENLMESATLLSLLRQSREYNDNQPSQN